MTGRLASDPLTTCLTFVMILLEYRVLTCPCDRRAPSAPAVTSSTGSGSPRSPTGSGAQINYELAAAIPFVQ